MRDTYNLDVWRDVDGSTAEMKLRSFDTPDEAMTAAVDKSEYAIVFVSSDYNDSFSCKIELGLLIKELRAKKLKKIYYVMLDKDYTPDHQSKIPITGLLKTAINLAYYWILSPVEDDFEEKLLSVTNEIAEDIQHRHEDLVKKLRDTGCANIPSIYITPTMNNSTHTTAGDNVNETFTPSPTTNDSGPVSHTSSSQEEETRPANTGTRTSTNTRNNSLEWVLVPLSITVVSIVVIISYRVLSSRK